MSYAILGHTFRDINSLVPVFGPQSKRRGEPEFLRCTNPAFGPQTKRRGMPEILRCISAGVNNDAFRNQDERVMR